MSIRPHHTLPEMVAAGGVGGHDHGLYPPGGCVGGRSGYLEPADQGQAGRDVQDNPGAQRAGEDHAGGAGMPTAGQGALPAEGFSHEPTTTVALLW